MNVIIGEENEVTGGLLLFFFFFKVKEFRECLYVVGSNLMERQG